MKKTDKTAPSKRAKRTIKVLVVDDSAMVREILRERLSQESGIEVVGTASDAYDARDMIVKLHPDVMTLDVEMPKMNGVEFLRRLMPQYPLPVVMVSSLTKKGKRIALDALEAGAIDFVAKPSADLGHGLDNMVMELCTKVKIASTANVSHWKKKRPPFSTAKQPLASEELKRVKLLRLELPPAALKQSLKLSANCRPHHREWLLSSTCRPCSLPCLPTGSIQRVPCW